MVKREQKIGIAQTVEPNKKNEIREYEPEATFVVQVIFWGKVDLKNLTDLILKILTRINKIIMKFFFQFLIRVNISLL